MQAGGYTDEFYLRFTSPRQSSLILGTSRAAQALQPAIFNQILERSDIYNYSFTIVHSPYGPVYLRSIKSKLDQSTKDGVFVLCVDPWSISFNGEFREETLPLGEVKVVNMNPNIFYLLKEYRNPFYKILQKSGEVFLHQDGWLEVSIPMDSAAVKERIKLKVQEYKTWHVPFYRMSDTRVQSLEETIGFLREHGAVYLVRLPVQNEILELDNNLVPDFNERMNKLSEKYGVPYLDLTPTSNLYHYTDGNHLYKDSGKEVSRVIAGWVSKQRPKD